MGVVGAAVALVALAFLPATGRAASPDPTVVDGGVVTAFDVSAAAGAPLLQVRRGDAVWAPEDVVLRADGDLARHQLPEQLPPRFAAVFEPGSTVFQLSAAGGDGVPGIGWSTERLASTWVGDQPLADRAVTLDLAVSGPGRVVAFTDPGDAAPLEVHLDSAASEAASVALPADHQAVPTWVFDRPGSYTLQARPTLHLGDGQSSVGAVSTYRVEVTAPAPAPTPPPVPIPATVAEPDPAPPVPVPPAPATEAPTAPSPQVRAAADTCAIPGLAADAVVAANGHYDFGVQVDGGRLLSRVKDDQTSPPTWRDPASVLLRLGDPAATAVPSGASYAFLGTAGSTVWTIGQTQEDGVPWLGWNTQHPSAVTGIDGATTWRLDSVDGPGELFVYQTGSFGRIDRRLGSPADWPKSLTIPSNVHAHANWSFTEPGAYRVTTTHAATLTSGAQVSSQATLYVQVGPCVDTSTQPTDPLGADRLLPQEALTDANRGGVGATPAAVPAGGTVSLTVPGHGAGTWLMPVAYPGATQLGWGQVSAEGRVAGVRLPRELPPGTHPLAAYDASGALVGWTPVEVTAPKDETADDAGPQDAERGDDGGGKNGDRGGDSRGDKDGDSRGDKGGAGDEPEGGDRSGDDAVSPGLPGSDGTGGGGLPTETCLPATDADATAPQGDAPTDDGSTTGPTTTGSPVSTGHFDFGSQIVDGSLVPRVKDDRTQPPTWVDPASVRFVLGAAAEQQVPADAAYAFMGEPGSTVWMVPQTQVDGIPWLGWNTQDESVRSNVEGPVRFTLDGVDGPGELAVYLTDSFGGVGQRSFGTVSGFPSSFTVPLNVHAHGNWVFTEAGSYAVTITQSARLASGETVSGRATLAFTVGGTTERLSPGSAGSTADRLAGPGPRSLVLGRPILEEPATATELPEAEPLPAPAAAGECVLAETGADETMRVLLPLGATMLTAGVVVLAAPYRRRLRTVGA